MDTVARFTGWWRSLLFVLPLAYSGSAPAGLPEIIDRLEWYRQGECWKVDLSLNVTFLPVAQFPHGASRYFYVLGLVAQEAGEASHLSRREQRRVRLGDGVGTLQVTYVGDLPGPKLLTFEAAIPMRYRLVEQEHGLSVAFVPGNRDTHCLSENNQYNSRRRGLNEHQ